MPVAGEINERLAETFEKVVNFWFSGANRPTIFSSEFRAIILSYAPDNCRNFLF